MKSLQRSCFNASTIFMALAIGPVGAGCAVVQSRETQSEVGSASPETSLQDDQKTIEDLRKNIPAAKRQENDQLKEILSLMGEVKDPPQRIRERFYKATQRIRQKHRQEAQRLREDYNRTEKRRRDEFYAKLKKERGDFERKKSVDRDARKYFFDDQDQRRRDFVADERDSRNQFNADLKTREDDFNSLMRDKSNDFNEELRAYTSRYRDYEKEQKRKREKPRQFPHDAASPLKTGDSDP